MYISSADLIRNKTKVKNEALNSLNNPTLSKNPGRGGTPPRFKKANHTLTLSACGNWLRHSLPALLDLSFITRNTGSPIKA